jgi:hypothetical protein
MSAATSRESARSAMETANRAVNLSAPAARRAERAAETALRASEAAFAVLKASGPHSEACALADAAAFEAYRLASRAASQALNTHARNMRIAFAAMAHVDKLEASARIAEGQAKLRSYAKLRRNQK